MFLDRILEQTFADLEQRKQDIPLEEVQLRASLQPPPRDLLAPFRDASSVSAIHLIAEVKRASPSKGMLAPTFDPVKLARTYEANGAAAISVLTEPHFFLGAAQHLTAIKQAVTIPVLCKDFIVDEYQIYEARAWGADAILLICAVLDDAQLRHLLNVAHAQHMSCLVEVHCAEEARRAVAAGAVIIGINSRDLASFQVNPHLLRELRQLIPADRVVVAESGIATASDARRLARYDIHALLVGESLVVSNDIATQMRSLLHAANASIQVKICGLRTPEHLHAAIVAGADLVGFIFHEPSPRYIEPQQARKLLETLEEQHTATEVVGVFVNKEAAFINDVIEQVGLNVVQLHGTEPPEFCQAMQRPVIKGLHLSTRNDLTKIIAYKQSTWRILLDTPAPQWGGTGSTHDWSLARAVAQETPIFLAGGLTPQNVAGAIARVRPWGVDVSSGIETNGQKDTEKIRAFIQKVRNINLMNVDYQKQPPYL